MTKNKKLKNKETKKLITEVETHSTEDLEPIMLKLDGKVGTIDDDGNELIMAFPSRPQNVFEVPPPKVEIPIMSDSSDTIRNLPNGYVDLGKNRTQSKGSSDKVSSKSENILVEKYEEQINKSDSDNSLMSKLGLNDKREDWNYYFAEISNVIFTALAIVYVITSEAVYKLYRLTGELNDGTKLAEIEISADEFQGQKWIHKRFGIQCRVGPHKNAYNIISANISEMFKNVKYLYVFKQVGWFMSKYGMIYIQGKKPIGYYGEDVSCECAHKIERSKNLSDKEAYRHVLKMLQIAPKQVTQTLLSFTLTAVIRQLFEDSGNIPRFILWLVSESGSYKTTISKIFSLIFNRTQNEVNASFDDTIASIEVKSAEYKDSVLLVDDFFPAQSYYQQNKINIVADFIIRAFGDTKAKSRMNSNMEKQKEFRPGGMCMVTAEDMHKGTSNRSRCLHLGIEKKTIDLDILSECQEHPKYFSSFIYYFIEYVSNNYDSIVKDLAFKFKTYRKEHINSYKHGRLLDSFITLSLAYQLFLDYGEEIGMIENDSACSELEEAMENFHNLVESMNLDLYIEDPGIMYAKAIEELISSNKIPISHTDDRNEERVGFLTNDQYFLFPELIYQEVVQFYNKQGIKYTATKTKSHNALRTLGVIDTDGQKNTVKKNIFHTGRRRYLIIHRDLLTKLLEEF